MKFFKLFCLVLLVVPILYVVQVPAIRYVSTATSPSLQDYPPIAARIESDTYELVLIYPGKTYDLWFDTVDQQFVGFSMNIESEIEYVVFFDLQGNLIETQNKAYDDYKRFEDNDRYRAVERLPNLEFDDTYSVKKLDGLIDLAHFQFETFTWPYMFYFIPVIRFDWTGTAFIEIPAGSEALKFSIPTDLKSQWAYLDRRVEVEIYAYRPDETLSDILFIQIDETYYFSSVDGDIHQDGLGFYVVRQK